MRLGCKLILSKKQCVGVQFEEIDFINRSHYIKGTVGTNMVDIALSNLLHLETLTDGLAQVGG